MFLCLFLVTGVIPVHPDSVVMGTIEDIIMARREEQVRDAVDEVFANR